MIRQLEIWLDKLVHGEDTPLNIPKEQLNLGGLYLDDAIRADISWWDDWQAALKVRDTTKYDVASLASADLCDVGQWLNGAGRIYETWPEHTQTKNAHTQFHLCAGEVLKLHQEGYFLDALMLSREKMVPLSHEMGIGFIQLLKAIHANNTKH